MQAIPYVIMAVAAGASAYSANRQAHAQSDQYAAAARANEYNEAILKERAAQTLDAYNQREESARREGRIERGKRLAMIGESGTGYGGSNADVERQNDMLSELDALNVRYQGSLEARGLLAQSSLEGMYGRTNMRSSSTATRLGYVSAASAALSGASNMYGYGSRRGGSGVDLSGWD